MSMKWSWLGKATADVLKSEEHLCLLKADVDEIEMPDESTNTVKSSYSVAYHGQQGGLRDFNPSARQLGRADKPDYDDMRRTYECQWMLTFLKALDNTHELQLFLQVERHDSRRKHLKRMLVQCEKWPGVK